MRIIIRYKPIILHVLVCSGQGLPHDVQHISSSLVVDGARPRLPSNTSARLSHGP